MYGTPEGLEKSLEFCGKCGQLEPKLGTKAHRVVLLKQVCVFVCVCICMCVCLCVCVSVCTYGPPWPPNLPMLANSRTQVCVCARIFVTIPFTTGVCL